MNIEHLEHLCSNHWGDRKGQIPDMIVMHVIEGTANSAIEWAKNKTSYFSPTYVSGANGRLVQMVDLDKGAWCNGDRKNPTSRLVKEREGINPNLYTFSIEHEGYSTKDRMGALTEEQYQASLCACKEIIKFVKSYYGKDFIIDREHIIGHYEINSVDKVNCPGINKGQYFPFDRFINDLRAWQSPLPFEVGQVIYAKEDINLYETAGYGGNVFLLSGKRKCIVAKYHEANGRYMALKDDKGNFYLCAWTKDFDKFTTSEPIIELPKEEVPNNGKPIEEKPIENNTPETNENTPNSNEDNSNTNTQVDTETKKIPSNWFIKLVLFILSKIFKK